MPLAPSNVSDPYPLERLFGRILSPFEHFLRTATAGGALLMAATVATLVLANSPAGDAWSRFWQQPVAIGSFDHAFKHTLREWVNDALMALFFLLVGLELKREVLVGELASFRDAALPIVAAAGGMIVPAAIYLALNPAGPAASGWGVPMATDIAFAIGILVMLGNRVPRALVVFLMALAIADDLGAVLAIAIAYTTGVDRGALASAAAILALLALLNRGGVREPLPYALLGIVLWYFVLRSGVHATIAGVLLALAIPARPACTPQRFDRRVSELLGTFRAHAEDPTTPSDALASPDMATIAFALERDAKAVQSPLHRAEHALGPWVTYIILPLFALANDIVHRFRSRGSFRRLRQSDYARHRARAAAREVHRHRRREWHRRSPRMGTAAGGRPMATPARRSVARRHRVHDVAVHQPARVRRCARRAREGRYPVRIVCKRADGNRVARALGALAATRLDDASTRTLGIVRLHGQYATDRVAS